MGLHHLAPEGLQEMLQTTEQGTHVGASKVFQSTREIAIFDQF